MPSRSNDWYDQGQMNLFCVSRGTNLPQGGGEEMVSTTEAISQICPLTQLDYTVFSVLLYVKSFQNRENLTLSC